MRNQTCMTPDPEDEQLDRLIKKFAEQQRKAQKNPPVYPFPVPSPTLPSGGGTLCADGTWSTASGRGTCSWHGGTAD
ncbi:hypothetical protein [Actinomadura viridis]|uniref:DUF3761 domain-containing protein n=1 Tax=Actinomadura viridis TaxID=58110 RepID=A0A931DMK8_9ACTN|nr:hypothetical protein [Actinomadura viridis]MBG6089865.1 hypothetical protein [Actinomadura viridis]